MGQPKRWISARAAVAVALGGCGLLAALPAAAQFPVPPPFIQKTASSQGGYQQDASYGSLFSNYQKLGKPDVLQHAESTLVNLGVPYLFADAEASGPGGATSDVTLEYFIQAKGPKNIEVPIIIEVNGLTTKVERSGGAVNTVAAAESRMWITNDDWNQDTENFGVFYDALALDQFGQSYVSSNNFAKFTTLNTRANQDRVAVTMDTHAAVSSFVNYSGKANATLDPLIYIDPSFADAAEYSLVVSAGVSNISPVPELGRAWLLAAGLLTLAGRRRLRPAAARQGHSQS